MTVEPVQSFARGLTVLTTFSGDYPRQTLSEVAERAGLARATARRLLHTLINAGYAATDGTTFWLTPRVLELGFTYLSALQLPDLAQPHLEAMSRELGETTSMSILDGFDIVYVSRVPTRRIMAVTITIGTRFPAHMTSMGRVLLAGLTPELIDAYFTTAELTARTAATTVNEQDLRREIQLARTQGYCFVDQELESGLRSVAAPVRGPDGETVAAINVALAASAHSVEEIHSSIAPAVVATASAISSDYRSLQGDARV